MPSNVNGISCEMLFCFMALTGCIVAQSTVHWLSAASVSLLDNICIHVGRQCLRLTVQLVKKATKQVLIHGKISFIILEQFNN